MKRICRAFVQNTILKLDILEVVSHYLSAGHRHTGNFLCPFHNDRQPSMGVKASEGYYHCFTCHAAGNLIQFVMHYRELAYATAIEEIAQLMGLQVRYVQVSPAEQERFKLLDTLTEVQSIYRKSFLNPAALFFLNSRGVKNITTQEEYGLGYGVDLDDSLHPEYVKAGVYRMTESQAYFHIFKRRITFPIRSPAGDILGFAGRSIGDIHPKYVNSTETLLFKKGRCVYGLYEALQRARSKAPQRPRKKLSQVLLVEGYFDVIALGQVSINAVASMGTTIKVEQLETIYRYANKIIVCMDGDSSGAQACENLLVCFARLHTNKALVYCTLPEGEDPDSFISKHGADAFKAFVCENALELHDYFIKLTKDANLLLTLHRAEAILSKLPPGYCKISLAHYFVQHYNLTTDMLPHDSSLRLSAQRSSVRGLPTSSPLPMTLRGALPQSQQPPLDLGMLTKEQWIVALSLQYPEACKPIVRHYDLTSFAPPLQSFFQAWLATTTTDIVALRSCLPELKYDIIFLANCNLSEVSQPQEWLAALLDQVGRSSPLLQPQLTAIFPNLQDNAQEVLMSSTYQDKLLYSPPLLLVHDQHEQNK